MTGKQDELYIQTLLWAYKKQEEGFTMDEIKESLGLEGARWSWWRNIFVTVNDNDRKLIELYHSAADGNEHRYTLNDKGMGAAVDYIELKEAREGSRKALWFAGVSMVIATAVGIMQIWVQLFTAG